MQFSFLFSFFLLNAVHGLTRPKEAPGEPGLADTCTYDIEKLYQYIARRACIGGMMWNKTCVYLPHTTGRAVNYYEAVRVCASSGGWLVKITDDKMYDMVYDYLNRTWVENKDSFRMFWLGMTFQPVKNPDHWITITPQWKITLNRWFSTAPITGSQFFTFVNMGMVVKLRGDSINKGIFNVRPIYYLIPLCQYQL